MKELFVIGAAILAGISVFAVIVKRSGGDCLP
jgi:hypothetical protein